MSRQLRLPSQDGVYVSAVEQDSAAEDAGITRGTIITRIIAGNQRFEIRNVDDFGKAERALRAGQEIAFMVLQQRGGQYRSAAPYHVPEGLQDQVGVLGVDLRDRLVGKDDLRLGDQCTRDRDTLLLAGR